MEDARRGSGHSGKATHQEPADVPVRSRHPARPRRLGIYKQTRVWVEADGRVLRQGTRVTVALFVGLVATKFALGTLANFWHVNDGAGLG